LRLVASTGRVTDSILGSRCKAAGRKKSASTGITARISSTKFQCDGWWLDGSVRFYCGARCGNLKAVVSCFGILRARQWWLTVAVRNSSKVRFQKRRAHRGRRNWILIAALALLILGFLVRRTLGPAALRYLTEPPRPHAVIGDSSQGSTSAGGSLPMVENSTVPSPASNPTQLESAQSERAQANQNQSAPVDEKLTDSDRRELESILRQKSK